ncbi:transmembrane anterior posterior transformation protein 1 homolog isoform X2 [Brachyhypopomus gauderio]|uniref:transmembrane anterior posterior transformation protein 1 homolog isoform X2 n=1 Tax=Brachyhypopomus gauderio TaxID=698409 RepID=UPI004041B7E2
MADSPGAGLSEEKRSPDEDKGRVRRSWINAPRSDEAAPVIGRTETIGFYDRPPREGEQRDVSGTADVSEPSLLRFMCAELTRGYFLEHNEAKYMERREKVYTCMRVPKELEKRSSRFRKKPVPFLPCHEHLGTFLRWEKPAVGEEGCSAAQAEERAGCPGRAPVVAAVDYAHLMIFGFFLCLDAFLYVFTLLPLRTLLALLRLLTIPCCGLGAHVCPFCRRSSSRFLQPAQVCDLLKGLIMVLCCSMMHYVDYAMMYHLIRGQSVIKLYIIYNMLEVADRLFSSFGQDILDALYWTATEPKSRKRAHIGVIPHFIMAVLYVFLHAILIMVQASTLNVAFNSHNKSLLTIMMSNNFVEIKGSVFKKFEKNNLFQMSNSDIKERFTNYALLLIVCLRNMEQFSWNSDHLWVLLPDAFMVVTSEITVDIVKHAFITKFNDITADVYREYKASLAFELVSSRQQNAYTDYSDSVARRMGFIPLPLAVLVSLLIRVVMSSVKVQGALSSVCLLLFYLGMITLKVLNSVVLLGKSCRYVKEANMEGKLFDKPSTTPKKMPGKTRTNSPSGEPKPQCPSLSITKQPTPRTTRPVRPTPSPLREESTEPPLECTPKPPEGSSDTPPELKHRAPKKDLLEIDRFTICGNRIL